MRIGLQRLALLAGSLVVALGLAEVLVRLLLAPPQVALVLPVDGGAPAVGAASSGGLYVDTPRGRRVQPRARVIIENEVLSGRTIEIATNALGYRNAEIGPKSRARVLFLGDSITFADYVPEDESFVRLVERLSEAGPEPLETINAGMPMAGLTTELAILAETGLATAPDVVVLDFYLNDLHDSVGIEFLRPPGWLWRSRLAHHLLGALSLALAGRDMESLATRIMARERGGDFSLETWAAWREEVARRFPPGEGDPTRDVPAFHRLVQKQFMDWGSAWSDQTWAQMAPAFRELKALADRRRFELRIVAFPVRQQVVADFVADYPQQKLRELAAGLGVPVLDLLPVLREAHRRGTGSLFYDHCHPTPLGNRVIAEAILSFLRQTRRG